MIHELKCWPENFEEIRIGAKPFEVRRDDRPYEAGHVLRLREFEAHANEFTGRVQDVLVTYIMRPHAAPPGYGYGEMPSIVIMAIKKLNPP